MKKTIVAAAVAALTAAPAMADVSISGQINQEFFNGTSDLESDTNTDVVFKGSEDLGNGMKASFVVHTMYDNSAASSTGGDSTARDLDGANADTSISLAGDFGKITVGTFEPMVEGMVVSMASTDAADVLSIENAQSSVGRTDGGARYMSPSFNGLTVGIEGFTDAGSAGDDFGATAVMVQYVNAGLTVKYASENVNSTGTDTDALAVQYKMGDLTLKAVDQDSSDNTKDDTFFGATYAMGNNTFGIGVIDSDTASDGDMIISAKHAMSKSTSVYLVVEDDDSAADNTTLVGIQHKF